MRQIATFPALDLPMPPAMPSKRTPEGIALGGIPGWEVFAGPEYLRGGVPRNRARPKASMTGLGGAPVLATFSNGAAAFDNTVSPQRAFIPGVAFPQSEWSAFAVLEPAITGSTDKAFFRSLTDQTDAAGLSIRMGLNNSVSRITMWRGAAASGNTFLEYAAPSGDFIGRRMLVLFCGSERGASIFVDGVEVAQTAAPAQITAGYQAGAWKIQAISGTRVGQYGVLSIDLGRPQHRAYRERITAFYKAKYGIS